MTPTEGPVKVGAMADPDANASVGRGHPRLSATLLVVATLVTFLAVFSIWINRQMLNTDNWVDTSGKLLENQAIQTQLATFLSAQLFDKVDVQGELQSALPPRLAPLAGPAAGGLHQLATQVAQRALDTPGVQGLWANANRAAHETLLKIVDGGGPAVSTNGGQVTLDLGAIVAQLGSQLGVGRDLASKLPADAGQITVLRSDQLSAAQSIAQFVRRLPIVLTLLAIVLYGLAVYLAGPRRRQALRSVGIGFIVAGAVALIARNLAGNAVVNALASTEAVRPAAQATWSIGTSLLVTVASSAITFGILVVVGAWLAGPTRAATALRRETSPYVRDHRGTAYAIAGAVFLALIAWAPIAALRKPIGILIFAALFALGTEVMRRQIVREFPDTQPGGLGERLHLRGARSAEGIARPHQEAPPTAVAGATPEETTPGELERLGTLHERGVLTDEEFSSAKASVLDKG